MMMVMVMVMATEIGLMIITTKTHQQHHRCGQGTTHGDWVLSEIVYKIWRLELEGKSSDNWNCDGDDSHAHSRGNGVMVMAMAKAV